jgi:trehalose-6-phosphate synthase
VEGVAEAIRQAVLMPHDERRKRMQRMRQKIRSQDIFWWVDTFQRAIRDEELGESESFEVYPPPTEVEVRD